MVAQCSPSELPAEGTIRVSLTDNRLEVMANLLDGESVDRLIQALQANKVLLPEKPPKQVSVDNLQHEQENADALNEVLE